MRRRPIHHLGTLSVLVLGCAASIAGCSTTQDDGDDSQDALTWMDNGCTGGPQDSERCDQGLFWFGRDNQSQQWRAGQSNRFYNPNQPTIIYVHGWQTGAIQSKQRETFNYKSNDPIAGVDINTANAWVERHWNVGIFYWDRLADEPGPKKWDVLPIPSPEAAEAKIWRTDGPTGMRWRKNDGTFETNDVPTKPAAELFFDTFVAAMRDFKGPELRIAGHSLGNQMAVHMVDLVGKAVASGSVPAAIMPKRIAMLDPFWSKQPIGSATRVGPARDVRDAVYMLSRNGVAIEQYRSSNINALGLGDDNPFVEQMTGYTEMRPGFSSWRDAIQPWKDLRSDHRAAPNLYFWSFAYAPPRNCKDGGPAGLSSSSEDKEVRQAMGSGRYFVQGGGRETASPIDDCVNVADDNLPVQSPVGLTWRRTGNPGTLDVQVQAPPGTKGMRYFIGGHLVANVTTRDGGANFHKVLGGLPNEAPETLIVASAFDKDDKLLGTSENMVDLTAGVGMSIRAVGNMTFEVSLDGAPSNLSWITLDVDGEPLIDDQTNESRSTRKAIRATFDQVDGVPRTFTVAGFDSGGAALVKLQRHFVLR